MDNRDFDRIEFKIPNASTNSESLAIGGMAFGALETPAAMTGATLAIEGRQGDADTWLPILDSSGTAQEITFAASSIIRVPDVVFACEHIRFVSASSEASERTLFLHVKS